MSIYVLARRSYFYSDFRISGFSVVRISGFPDFRMSGFPDVRISGFQDIWISGFPESRNLKMCWNIRAGYLCTDIPDIQMCWKHLKSAALAHLACRYDFMTALQDLVVNLFLAGFLECPDVRKNCILMQILPNCRKKPTTLTNCFYLQCPTMFQQSPDIQVTVGTPYFDPSRRFGGKWGQ